MKKAVLSFLLLAGSTLMAQSGPLANGVYSVEESSANAKSPVIRPFKGKDLVLDRTGFAPLIAEGKPEVRKDPRGSYLEIQLAPEAAKRLEELSRSHLNRPIAVVVGDKILSAPIVRSVIQDGKARVTPCADESCQALLRELTK